MATIHKFSNGNVALECLECGRLRDVKDFRGNTERSDGWFLMCKPCRRRAGESIDDPDAQSILVSIYAQMQEANLNPENWDDKVHTCGKCDGTGQYMHYGQCHQCRGKGYETWRDLAQNQLYWTKRAVKEIAGDMASAQETTKEEPKPKKAKQKALPKPEAEKCDAQGEEWKDYSPFDSKEEYDAFMKKTMDLQL